MKKLLNALKRLETAFKDLSSSLSGSLSGNASTTLSTDSQLDVYEPQNTTVVNGVIVKIKTHNYLRVNFNGLGEKLLSINDSDHVDFNDGDRASGLLCRLFDECSKQHRRAVYGDISDGYIFPATLQPPTVEVKPVEITTVETTVDSVVTDENTDTNIDSECKLFFPSKGRGFTASLSGYKLVAYGVKNTSLWKSEKDPSDNVLRLIQDFNWSMIMQILESAVLECGLSISKAYSAYAQLVGQAVRDHGIDRNSTMLWWKALSQLAQEV